MTTTAAGTIALQLQTRDKKMPFKSMAQMRWGNSSAGKKALGTAGVKEWDDSTKGAKLPERVGKKLMRKKR